MREWFQTVTFTKKYSGDNIQKIIQTYNYRLIENQRELYLENGIRRTIENYIQRITFKVLHSEKTYRETFRDLHNFHIFPAQERNQ